MRSTGAGNVNQRTSISEGLAQGSHTPRLNENDIPSGLGLVHTKRCQRGFRGDE